MAGKKRKSAMRKPSVQVFAKADPVVSGFDLGLDAHESDDLERAEGLYRSFLLDHPKHGRCHYFLGLLLSQKGDLEAAVEQMVHGLGLDPQSPTGHNNLGTIFIRLNRPLEAERAFLTALDQDPSLNQAHINLGSIYQKDGRTTKAEDCFRKALEIDPNSAETCVNLGALLRQKGCLQEAESILHHAVVCQPLLASAHNNLGIVLHEKGQLKPAFMAFKRAQEIDPQFGDAFNNMGTVFRDQNQLDAALACYDKALTLDVTSADAHNNKGSVLQRLGRLEEAEAYFKKANDLKPTFLPALVNLAAVLHKTGRSSQARAQYEKAIAIDPDCTEAHFGLAELLLYLGDDLEQGWQEHFWRWQKKELRDQWQECYCPLWQGENLNQKTIRVWGEQGIGEEIMYATFLPDLIEQGASIQLESDDRLIPLLKRSFPEMDCRGRADDAPFERPCDYHSSAADLGRWLRPDMASFPPRPSLLAADPEQRNRLRERYEVNDERPVIGISWQSSNSEIGQEKSIDLNAWAPVLKRADKATLVNLQYGDTSAQRARLKSELDIHLIHDPNIDQMRDLDGFAAQVAAMDLVISISNTTVHMAGALGVPTWCLLSSMPLWRWFKGRNDCPWYPSVQFFRQKERGEWGDVLTRVGHALETRLSSF